MAVKHATVKAPGNTLAAITDWNASHVADGNTGEILFRAAAGDISTDSDLFWDAVNKRLGIGTAIPLTPLHIKADNSANAIRIEENSGGQFSTITYDSAGTLKFRNSAGAEVLNILDNGTAIQIPRRIEHIGDINTEMEFDSKTIKLNVVGWTYMIMKDATQNYISFNAGLLDVDFSIQSNLGGSFFFFEGSSGNVGIGSSAPQGKLHVGDQATNYLKVKSDGEIELVGTARVIKEIELKAAELHPPAANNPALSEIGVFPVALFDPVSDEELYTQFHLPRDYVDGSDLYLHFHWAPTDAGAGDVTWGIEWKAVTDDNNETLGAGATQIVVDTTQGLANEMLGTANITIDGTGIIRKDIIGIRVFRDANASEGGASDTYGSDAALSTIAIEYLSDRLGEAT